MITYFPILKAKQGELNALAGWNFPYRELVSPILEIVPWERDDDSPDAPEIHKVVNRIEKAWFHDSGVLFIDAAAAEQDPENGWAGGNFTPVLGEIVRMLHEKRIFVAPVLRASAQADYIRALVPLLGTSATGRALIRITVEDLDDTVTPLRDVVGRIADELGLPRSQVDVVVDFGSVADEQSMLSAARLARFVLPQLDDGSWRALVVSGGAFPVNLSDVSPGAVGRFRRLDADLWRSVSKLNLRVPVQFSDYAVTHPALPLGAAFAAPPQLRYTHGNEWLVAKGRKIDRKGHAQFFDICAQILTAAGEPAPGPEASWGDSRIHLAARQSWDSDLQEIGPGNASTWRAIATSHHLALIASRLNEWDAP